MCIVHQETIWNNIHTLLLKSALEGLGVAQEDQMSKQCDNCPSPVQIIWLELLTLVQLMVADYYLVTTKVLVIHKKAS